MLTPIVDKTGVAVWCCDALRRGETAPVTDTVSEATDEDMFVSGGGEAADRATSSDSEEEEEVSRRPQRNRRAPNRPDV